MKQATFYLLHAPAPVDAPSNLTSHELLACQLAADAWRSGLRVLLACASQQNAFRLDEALWQFDPQQFVPHNLAGEGPHYGSPVEIAWPEKRNASRRDLLISLLPQVADFASAFTQVVDFVPYDETLKQLARERYKAYRQAGFQLATHDLGVTPSTN
ncbi:MAG: DNA polymerase III subunit chi [Plesiomonas sp.]|uniref:DNA polymerase III subunit chi n=1 Tax=Plesiomonas sp. TaxID=2486279 RepID=UPI003F367592